MTGSHIHPLLKHVAASVAIALFRTVRFLKRRLQPAAACLARGAFVAGRLIARILILPFYRLAITLKIRFQRLTLPTQSAVLLVITNRYLFHAALGFAVLATLVVNLQARQAHAQDVGKNSMLYALATGSDASVIQETAADVTPSKPVSYLDRSTLIAIPGLDFDYDEGPADIASVSVPGAIAALPMDLESSRMPRTNTETYVVQEGDTIGSIARSFGVNAGTILWSNGLTERQYIRPGDALRIPPVSGILVTLKKGDTVAKLAKRYGADAEEILAMNRVTDETALALGTELVIPGGAPPLPDQTLAAIATRAAQPAAPSGVKKPADANTKNLPAAKLLWPTSGHAITQYYGWRHTGIDLDGDYSSPLYAAYDGVVEKSGWNSGGYGNMILIRHPNGMMTRYAHASKLFVKAGDAVKRGQVIAMMGTTGRSTGTHLHFEVYVNGVRTNPLPYIR